MTETEELLGYSVCRVGVAECVASIADWIARGSTCRWLACINPHSYVVSREDLLFARSLRNADWLIPDGTGILLASRILGGRIHERVTGSDIFRGVNASLNEIGGSVFFLGATVETLESIREKFHRDYPHIRVVGMHSPPFRSAFLLQETEEMVTAINAVIPDVLWVGMSSPKQDIWLYQNRHRLRVKFAAGVGAVFDFYIDRVRRSHTFFQKLGLEWLPRLLREPRRLWKRTLVSAPIFMRDVLRQRFALHKKN